MACGKPIGLGSKVSYVAADDRDGARDMTRHLLSLGRRRIGTVTGPLDTPGGIERLAGYKEVLAESGIDVDDDLIVSGDYSRLSGERGAERLLAQVPDLDAVFVASDLMARGVLTTLERAGRRVPEDVAVGGFDDSPRRWRPAPNSPRCGSRSTGSVRRWCGCCWRRSAGRTRRR